MKYLVLSMLLFSHPLLFSKAIEKNDHKSNQNRSRNERIKQATLIYQNIAQLIYAEKRHQEDQVKKEINSLSKKIQSDFPSKDVYKTFLKYKTKNNRTNFNAFMLEFTSYRNGLENRNQK